ncbi:MAG: hypothetical protein JOY85_21360 [Acidobacteriaceae bacterium]|nr:hypothetical protein [Acidobacteriaceae bacterium]
MLRHFPILFSDKYIQVVYAPNVDGTNLALAVKAAMLRELGLEVNICVNRHEMKASAN